MRDFFDENLTRLDVLSLPKKEVSKEINVVVHRNHSIEMVTNIINSFLNYSKISANFELSSYDDSLTYGELKNESDLQILWLDLNRYNKNEVKKFLSEKITELRTLVKSPILVCYLADDIKDLSIDISDCYFVNISKAVESLGDNAYDLKKEAVSGTRLSAKSSIVIAQYLGLKIIPSILKPALKAIVLDLDNTLYKGILGEDGIDNLVPYNKLQTKLKELKKQGFILAIASKNEEKDVIELFTKRNDFILKIEDFNCIYANWNIKSDNIKQIAKDLNIGLDSILFIDDNIAEIENVSSFIPEINTILAINEQTTLRYLDLYPCLIKKSVSREDLLRSKDLQANKEREELSKTLSKEEYFKKLDMRIEITVNDINNADRITELLNKTNQFILSYKRYNKTEVTDLLKSKDCCIITSRMSDKLSDSGIIAILIAKKSDKNLIVDELTFSCRALGRNIEDIVITKMMLLAIDELKTSNSVIINYQKGARNLPAQNWLSAYTNQKLKEYGSIVKTITSNFETYGLKMEVKKIMSEVI